MQIQEIVGVPTIFFPVISLPWHCISTDVWLHTFNTEGSWWAQRIFCHFHVSSPGNWAWEADWRHSAVLLLELWCCPLFQNKTKKGFFFIDTETYLTVELCVQSTCYHYHCYTPTKNRRLHCRIRKCVRNAKIFFFQPNLCKSLVCFLFLSVSRPKTQKRSFWWCWFLIKDKRQI